MSVAGHARASAHRARGIRGWMGKSHLRTSLFTRCALHGARAKSQPPSRLGVTRTRKKAPIPCGTGASHSSLYGRSALLEFFRRELMPAEQFVEVRAIALGESRGLTHVATRDLQDLREIAACELIARLVEGGQATRAAAERLLHELHGNDRRLRERDVLAHDVLQLTDIARPIGRREQLHGLRRVDLAHAALLRDLREEVRDEQRDVLSAPVE